MDSTRIKNMDVSLYTKDVILSPEDVRSDPLIKSESGWDLKRIRLTISGILVRRSGKNTA